MKTLTAKKALSLLAEVVADFGGGHVYEKICRPGASLAGCYNWDTVNNCPSCLVGHVMYRWGVPGEFLSMHLGASAQELSADINASYHLEFQVEHDAMAVLAEAQGIQDAQKTWGSALAGAVKAYACLEDVD